MSKPRTERTDPMSETEEMRHGDTTMTITHNGASVETTIDEMQRVADRLAGTDYVKVTFAKANGIEWLETPPRLGDELKLTLIVTATAVGRRLTDDGIQATATLEVVGVTRLD